MKTLISLCVGFLIAVQYVVPNYAQEAHQLPKFDESNAHYIKYRDLVNRVKNNDFEIDFVGLIAAASDWDISAKYSNKAPNRKLMVDAFEAKDYRKSAELAEMVLEYEFTNISLHNAIANAYLELGKPNKAEFHKKVAEKLLEALLSTGDGKGFETAYCVQGINEEYMIMKHFGYKVSQQAAIGGNRSTYDALTGENSKTGETATLLFDISGFFTRCIQHHRKE